MSNPIKTSSSSLADAASDAIKSGNPIKIVGGIALGTLVVGGYAIRIITELSKK